MPSAAVIIGVGTPSPVRASTDRKFSYRILRFSDGADLGGLRGVKNEPVFTSQINQGSGALTLTIDHYPGDIPWGSVIRVNYPSGQVAGYWLHEARPVKQNPREYQIVLAPLAAEATSADYWQNWTTDPGRQGTPRGPALMDTPVAQALANTRHLTPGALNNNGNLYSYAYTYGHVVDTLNQAILFGGAGWWWFIDHQGFVFLRNSSPFQHVLTTDRDVYDDLFSEDIHSLWNGQPVTGGTPSNGTAPFSAFAADYNPASPFSVPNLGRKTNSVYSDTSLLDQATVNAVAASLLAYHERVAGTATISITDYTVRRPQPGDAVLLRSSSPNPAEGDYVVKGPFLITKVTEYGAQNRFELVLSSDTVVPISTLAPLLNRDHVISKFLENGVPGAAPISADGTTLASGVTLSPSIIGPLGASVPSPPVGIAGTTLIDLLSQTNQAAVTLSWSAPNVNDIVTRWVVRWRKAADPDVSGSYATCPATTNGGTKIGGLIQGIGYVFQVQAFNDLNKGSGWSSYTITTSTDLVAPAPPTNVTAYRTPRGALLTWDGTASASQGDLQGYLLQVNLQGDGVGMRQINVQPYLGTSYQYTAPDKDASGRTVLPGATLVFQVQSVDWSNNVSAPSTATTDILTHGVLFDEVLAGNITAVGTLQGGKIQSGGTGPRWEGDAAGIRLYDGTLNDHGGGPGITTNLKSQDGSAFFSGVVSASTIQSPIGASPRADFYMTGTPRLVFTDGGGVPRVQVGSFTSAYDGSSQYGMQALAADGTAIFDTAGLIKVMSSVASSYFSQLGGTGSVFMTVPTSLVAVVNSTTNAFTMARPGKVLVLMHIYGNTSSVNPGPVLAYAYCNGNTGIPVVCASSPPFGGTAWGVFSLPAGSFTACIAAISQSGNATLSPVVEAVNVFLLGG